MLTTLTLFLLLAAPADHPGNDASRETAREDARLAAAEFNLGHYAQAASLYEQAYRLVSDPVLLYDLGQSFRLAGEPGKAILAYRAYLRTSAETAPNRQHARELIVELGAAVEMPPDMPHGGSGACVASGTCSSGYHDGGTGTCVGVSICSTGYSICAGSCSTGTCPGTVWPGGACTSDRDCIPGYGCRGTTGSPVCSQNLVASATSGFERGKKKSSFWFLTNAA